MNRQKTEAYETIKVCAQISRFLLYSPDCSELIESCSMLYCENCSELPKFSNNTARICFYNELNTKLILAEHSSVFPNGVPYISKVIIRNFAISCGFAES